MSNNIKIHQLNCGTFCPLGAKWFLEDKCKHTMCRCWLIETPKSLVLVDTGFSTKVLKRLNHSPSRSLQFFGRPLLDPREDAITQIEAMGFKSQDVQHIILTHLDPDHAGGIQDFPHATIHVLKDEWQVANHPQTYIEKMRYEKILWQHGAKWQLHGEGETWMGLKSITAIPTLGPDILLIPMSGHTLGHTAVAVRNHEGWHLHVGDAIFSRRELQIGHKAPLPLEVFQQFMASDNTRRLQNRNIIQKLAERGDIRITSSHAP